MSEKVNEAEQIEGAATTSDGRAALPSEDTKPPDMPWFIPNDDERGVYRFILASAKRARQLQAGARPTISTTSRKPTRIGMEELRQGAVGVELIELEETAEQQAASKLIDQPVRATAPPPEPTNDDLLNSDS